MAKATVHATAISIDGHGVLIRGNSGAGKSDIALRLLHAGDCGSGWPGSTRWVQLIADDRVELEARNGRLIAAPPAAIAGLIEVRGIGIVSLPFVSDIEIALVVDLVEPHVVPRMAPEPKEMQVEILGIGLPGVALAAFEASAPLKVLVAVRQFCR